ncbi:hypothetical protein DRO54_01890 [Candidatus Bathyarchaeota archaeon]|nr:MAG: hypothetical protein DRO54_01890 [Candidatus Bathyarchaeota archaeon]
MNLKENVKKLLGMLEGFQPKQFSVVVMPDFFLDRFVSIDTDVADFSKILASIASRKGGAVDEVKQLEFRGGNAANTASALAKLGAKVYAIINTGRLGLVMLKHYLQPLGVDLSRVKANGETSITTALELKYDKERINVMLRDLGSLKNFGPENLEEEDFELLARADYVCLFNWAGTRKYGTELAKTVFSHVKIHGKGKTYFDTADPSPNKKAIKRLVNEVLLANLIDILSLNENEAIWYGSAICKGKEKGKEDRSLEEKAKENAKQLARCINGRVDLHTTKFSSTFLREEAEFSVPTFKVNVLRVTGAGDAWNAGNIFADAQGFSHELRLTFANAVAAYYISNPNAEHPTLEDLRKFLKRQVKREKL